jgi:hypothetical protein
MYLKFRSNDKEVIEDIIFDDPVKSYETKNFDFDLETFVTLELFHDESREYKPSFHTAQFCYPNGFTQYMRIEPKTLDSIKPYEAFYRPLNDSRGKKQESKEFFSTITNVIMHVAFTKYVTKCLNFKIH